MSEQNKTDKNFDDLAAHFANKIYSSQKGEVRLELVIQEMPRVLPILDQGKPLRILDIGGGLGQISLFLATLGHHIVYCDSSENMLSQFQETLSGYSQDLQGRVELHHCSLQDLSGKLNSYQFDGVVFHAVLEWLAEPREGLSNIIQWIKPGGFLSLMFYNRHSLVFKNLIRGNFKKVESGDFAGEPGSLTPLNPLDPDEVVEWLREFGVNLEASRGIRCFYDYMNKNLERSTEDVLRLETEFGVQEPYMNLARYLLFHGIKAS